MSLNDRLIANRPHGGMSVLWNKSLSNAIKTIQYDDNRILGIEIKSNSSTCLFLSVYLPYECDMYYDDFCFYLSKLQCIIASSNTPYVFILGDFNADIQSTSILVLNTLISVIIMNCVLLTERGYCPTHLLILVKLMALHHGWTTALLRQVNLSYLMYRSLIMLYVLIIFHCVLK